MSAAPNLLPTTLLARRSRRAHVRRWLMVLALEVAVGAGVGILSRMDYANPAVQARRTIASTVGQIDVVSAAMAVSAHELQAIQKRLAVAMEVAGQPDWSVVLGAIAWRGQDVVNLHSTQLLAPMAREAGSALRYRVSLLGDSATRGEVTRFVEALEGTGIFSQVRISQTQAVRSPSEDGVERVGFTIEAWLGGEGG